MQVDTLARSLSLNPDPGSNRQLASWIGIGAVVGGTLFGVLAGLHNKLGISVLAAGEIGFVTGLVVFVGGLIWGSSRSP